MIPYSTEKLQQYFFTWLQHFATLLWCCNLAKKCCCNFSVMYGMRNENITWIIICLKINFHRWHDSQPRRTWTCLLWYYFPIVYYNININCAERFPGCLRVLIHGLMPTFCEHCSSLHQGEKQPDTKLLLWRIPYVY